MKEDPLSAMALDAVLSLFPVHPHFKVYMVFGMGDLAALAGEINKRYEGCKALEKLLVIYQPLATREQAYVNKLGMALHLNGAGTVAPLLQIVTHLAKYMLTCEPSNEMALGDQNDAAPAKHTKLVENNSGQDVLHDWAIATLAEHSREMVMIFLHQAKNVVEGNIIAAERYRSEPDDKNIKCLIDRFIDNEMIYWRQVAPDLARLSTKMNDLGVDRLKYTVLCDFEEEVDVLDSLREDVIYNRSDQDKSNCDSLAQAIEEILISWRKRYELWMRGSG